ncbi:hypothetical protein O0I10_007137 [Lichtheimia ornata]|uniref:Uncharacterized protein n=1 Tax=Lichtheimia ornata TaxID=688661 RepID=A0AAD7V1R9_9FUNG|nr:uncharacterized protein O0I10_007137 [Lichtheimia ornata]KAJ8657058.1 hypothetical protein O0I10_007137 [Lichtheimia ornata]
MSSANHSSDIPQFVVIRDQVHNTYKHPIVHYVFEDEPFPEVTKENLILVDLDDNAQLSEIDSYSPHFQVIDCRLDHNSTVYDQFDGAHDGTGLMTIEGVSAPKANEAIESLQPVRNLDNLRETIFNFKTRNEMVKRVFASSSSSPFSSSSQQQQQQQQQQPRPSSAAATASSISSSFECHSPNRS